MYVADSDKDVALEYRDLINMLNVGKRLINAKNSNFFNNFTSESTSLFSYIDDDVTERTDLQELLATCGNSQLSKMILVFASYINEMNFLSTEAIEYYMKAIMTYAYGTKTANKQYTPTQPSSRLSVTSSQLISELNLVSNILPLMHDLYNFVDHCFTVIKSTISQIDRYLCLISNNSVPSKMIVPDLPSNTMFDAIFVSLMDLLVTLISLDDILTNHTNLRLNLINYKRTIDTILANPTLMDMKNQINRLQTLSRFINEIEINLLDEKKSIFSQCIEQMQTVSPKTVRLNNQFMDRLNNFIKNSLERIMQSSPISYATSSNLLRRDDQKLLGISSIFIVYTWIFKKEDKRLLRYIMDCQKRKELYIIHLFGSNSFILLEKFLAQHITKSMIDKSFFNSLSSQRDSLLRVPIEKDLRIFTSRVTYWLVQFETESIRQQEISENYMQTLESRANLYRDGIDLINTIVYYVKSLMAIYLHHTKPMTKSNLISVLRMIPLIKSIQVSFERHKSFVQESIIRLNQLRSTQLLRLMSLLRRKLSNQVYKYSEKKLDMISAVILTANCLNGSMLTNSRQILVSLCLPVIAPILESSELSKVNSLSQSFDLRIYEYLSASADCSFLYWSIPTFGTYFNYCLEENPCPLDELRYFLLCLSEIKRLYIIDDQVLNFHADQSMTGDIGSSTTTTESTQSLKEIGRELMSKVEKDIYERLRIDFLDKICQEFETELRLQTHRDLQLDDQSPFKRHLYNFKRILNCGPIRYFDNLIFIKREVEYHLDKICYNLTSIARHDWFTYDTMLNMARHKYGLTFVDNQLPTQTLEQGLDILGITRNLSLFVARYNHNLHNQMFIEKTIIAPTENSNQSISNRQQQHCYNKQLNVVLIKHVANSIKTHGFGIINTAVNFTYQLMRKQLSAFSHYLHDEHIRLRLAKDMCHFKENANSGEDKYTYERADRLLNYFKRYGLAQQQEQQVATGETNAIPNSVNYLDALRNNITQIGNALAFVRMLRSGALNCVSQSVNFIPDLDDLSELRLLDSARMEFPDEPILIRATENFDLCLEELNKNFTSKTNYFSILVSVFKETFHLSNDKPSDNSNDSTSTGESCEPTAQGDSASSATTNNSSNLTKSDHLKNFPMILPALTINYVHNIMACKERLFSRTVNNRIGSALSDDGFPIGVAFILTVLNQTSQFESYQWFNEVMDKINRSRQETRNRVEEFRSDEKLSQTSTMTLKRLDALEREFKQLMYSLRCSLILYRENNL